MMDLDEFQNEQSMEMLGDVYRASKCNTEYGVDDDENDKQDDDDDDEYYDAVSQFRYFFYYLMNVYIFKMAT